jgi:Anaerobic ribonucleoside-triphosphate reductase
MTSNTAPQPEATITLQDAERQRCEVWTRVMGYHRPLSAFNTGKQGEFEERRHFVEHRDDPQR